MIFGRMEGNTYDVSMGLWLDGWINQGDEEREWYMYESINEWTDRRIKIAMVESVQILFTDMNVRSDGWIYAHNE